VPLRGSTLNGGPVGTPWHLSGRMSPVRAIPHPAVGDRENRLALLAHAAQVAHQVLERVERQLFVTAVDHLGGDAVLVRAPDGRLRRSDNTAVGRSCGSGTLHPVAFPQCQYRVSNRSIVVVLRAKVMSAADISGVITATRSSWPITRSSASTSGFRIACDAPMSDVVGIEEQDEQSRFRLLAIARDSRTVFGSIRVSCGPEARTTTRSNCSMVCGAPPSRISKSAWSDPSPARRRGGWIGVDADVVGLGAEVGCGGGVGVCASAATPRRAARGQCAVQPQLFHRGSCAGEVSLSPGPSGQQGLDSFRAPAR
jgi:hypothetical protein